MKGHILVLLLNLYPQILAKDMMRGAATSPPDSHYKEPTFKEQLFNYIEHSKKDAKWRIVASNVITILVRAGIRFIGADLRSIRIPGADLSFGIFDSAQFQDADFKKGHPCICRDA
ncbi:MAG: hypothetical protein J3Q66DRAFT_437746 [Benniella sp.]|nr:MAG: hypothetical protein J3Q66DRAFT_437746 [Benniella sp.]